MINILNTFGLSVLSFYTFYRCYLENANECYAYFFNDFVWFILYFLLTIIVIYASEQVTGEVNIFLLNLFWKWDFHMLIHIPLQGKATFEIAHEIINDCAETDINSSVCHLKNWIIENDFVICYRCGVLISILKLFQLAQQTEHRHPIISCGLFTFDWGLLFNVSVTSLEWSWNCLRSNSFFRW